MTVMFDGDGNQRPTDESKAVTDHTSANFSHRNES